MQVCRSSTRRSALAVAVASAALILVPAGEAVASTVTYAVSGSIAIGGPYAVDVDPASHSVYVANFSSNTVSVIDSGTNTVKATIGVGSGPRAVAVDSAAHRVYVANSTNTVSVIATTTNTVVASVAVGLHPYGVAIDPITHTAYVTISTGGVSVVSEATNSVVSTIALGGYPYGIGVDPATHLIYATSYNAGLLSVINGTSRKVVATITVGAKPRSVAIDSAAHRAYVSNIAAGTVSVIDTGTNTVLTSIAVGLNPDGIAVDTSNHRVFVANGGDGSVSVIDQATNTVQMTVTSGRGAQALALDPNQLALYVCNTSDGTVSVITRQLPGVTIGRLAGPDRFATAVTVSQAAFPSGGAGAVVLADGGNYPDALVGSPLAAAKSAPLLLTSGPALSPGTRAEIQRVLPAGGTVYVLGGTVAVPASVAADLTTLGYTVVRYGGATRFATAVSVADALGDPTTVLLATGANFPDALAAGVAAAKAGGVVLLTNGSTMPPETSNYLTARAPTVFALGGAAAAADPAATAIVGADRYDTAAGVARQFFTSPGVVGIASGAGFADALSGGAYLAHIGGALLLSPPTQLSVSDSSYLATLAGNTLSVQLFGGTSALGTGVQSGVFVALGG